MINKSNKSLMIGIVLLLLIAVVYMAGMYLRSKQNASTELPKVIVGYNIQSLDTVPLMIAYQKDYFKNQGIKVELVQVTGSEGAVAIGGGKVDVVITSAARLYSPIEKGAPIKMISPMSNTDSQLFVRPDSGIKTFKDLEGKKISYGLGGGTKEVFLKSILKTENVDLSKITFVDVENTFLHVALMDKKTIDVALISDAGYVDQAQKLNAVIMPEWAAKKYEKLPTGLVVAANTDYLNKNENNVRAFFKAIIEGNRYLKSNLDDASVIATKFIKDNTNGATDIKAEDFKNLMTTGRVSYVISEDTKVVTDMAKMSFELGKVGKVLTVDDLYDFRFKSLLEAGQQDVYGTKTN